MAVTDEFFQSRREGPVNAVAGMLGAWFAERKRMNEEAYAAETGGEEDPAELAKMELRAREGAAEMQRTLAEAIRQGKNDESEILRELVRQQGGIIRENIQAGSAKAVARLGLVQRLYDQATTENANLAKEAQFTNEELDLLDTIERTTRGARPEAIRSQFEDVATKTKAGMPNSARYDALAAEFERRMIAAGRPDTAAVSALIGNRNDGKSAVEWYAFRHSPATYEAMSKAADEESRRAGGGGADPNSLVRNLAAMGVDTASLAKQTGGGETTRTRDVSGGGGNAPDDDTVNLAFRGDPNAVAAYAKARQSGADPYESIQAGIDAMNAYAEDLAARRAEARSNRAKPFPRANIYVANPNRYVPEQGQRAAMVVAKDDPGRNRERASALARGESARGIPAEFAPGEFNAPQFEREGDDLLAWLADNMGPIEFTDNDGKYRYRLNLDGSVTILASPVKGAKVPTEVAADSDAAKAIRKQASDRGVHGVAEVLATQPPEVRALFEPAIVAAEMGDVAGARRRVGLVDPDDVRYAYASAFRQASSDPTKVEGLRAALSTLPETVMPETRGALGRTLDRYREGQSRGGEWARTRATGELDSVGKALVGASGTGAKRDARAVTEGRDRDDETNLRAGADLVDLALGQGRSADDIRAGWEKAPDSAVKRGALARVGPWGGGPDKVARETAETSRTGRLPSVETGKDEVRKVERPTVKAPDTAAVKASEAPAPKPVGLSEDDTSFLDAEDTPATPLTDADTAFLDG